MKPVIIMGPRPKKEFAIADIHLTQVARVISDASKNRQTFPSLTLHNASHALILHVIYFVFIKFAVSFKIEFGYTGIFESCFVQYQLRSNKIG